MSEKRARGEEGAEEEPLTKHNDEKEAYWNLTETRRATVRKFKKMVFVDVREYYSDKDGTMKPGKKGISLTPEQWKELKLAAPLIDAEVAKLKE